jgi:Zn-dependent protease with chaperone function
VKTVIAPTSTEKNNSSDLARRLAESLTGRIEPVRAGLAYRTGLVTVAVVMLVLPVIYLALVGLVCYGLYLHAVHDTTVLDREWGRLGAVAYIAPFFVGGILLAFMIRPLLIRRQDDSVPLTLRRGDEPALFDFVYRLCHTLGAPSPVRIDVDLAVNASASFRGGLRGLLGRELVLTIGLPLAACFDACQFAGVLAHELGHFSQGSAMRLTYIVRRINAWFFRVVYYRDHWDRALARASSDKHWVIMLVALLARGMVWLVRRILWGFMTIGNAVSAIMMRQMEFDADRYQCRVAGSDGFDETFGRLRCVSAAESFALSDLAGAWRERRLADDLAGFIRARETDMPGELRAALQEETGGRSTGWFDSHPCHADRLAAAKRLNEKGIFTADAPATELFTDFAALSRIATMLFYRQQIGPAFQPSQLVQTGNLVAARVEQEQTHDALVRHFGDLIDARRPLFPGPIPPPPADLHAATARLLELRLRLQVRLNAARSAAAVYAEQDDRATTLAAVRELRTAGYRKSGVKDASLDALSDDALRAAEAAAKTARDRAAAIIEQAVGIGMERLELALSLEHAPQPTPATVETSPDDDFGQYDLADEAPAGATDHPRAALSDLRRVASQIELLRWHGLGLRLLARMLQPHANPQPLIDAVLWHSRKAAGLLREIFQHLGQAAYPYAESGKRLTLAAYMIPAMPPPEVVGRVLTASTSATTAYRTLYRRLMSDLASRAEQVETSLGLSPLEPAETQD